MLLEIERGRTRSQSVDNSLWKRLGICRKTDYVRSECHCIKNWASVVTGGQCTDVLTRCFLKKCKYLCHSAFTSYFVVKSGTRIMLVGRKKEE